MPSRVGGELLQIASGSWAVARHRESIAIADDAGDADTVGAEPWLQDVQARTGEQE